MDISKKKFKIIEGIAEFEVWVEVPKYKTRGMFWWKKAYYDEQDMQWAIVGMDGNLMYAGKRGQPARFINMTEARAFVKKVQSPKRETVIEPPEVKEVAMRSEETASGGAR